MANKSNKIGCSDLMIQEKKCYIQHKALAWICVLHATGFDESTEKQTMPTKKKVNALQIFSNLKRLNESEEEKSM